MKFTHVILAVKMKKTIKPLAYFAVIIVIILSFLSLSRAVSASPPSLQIEATAPPLTTNTVAPTSTINPDTIGDTSGVIVVGIIIVFIILAGIIWGGIVYQREIYDHN